MPENYKNKTIGELIDDSTEILTKFTKSDNYKSIRLVNFSCMAGPNGRTVVLDYVSGFVLITNGDNAEALFNVYEIRSHSINTKRGLLTVTGHETINQYWFDDGEYEVDYTR
ncbi:hypothetical protein LCGC14_1697400 [marine sediment metagenome]|uniref:Uncharacterized protein n=1 Tax=marine sediment metagenome TaxID=412755 RepID=A0A0F9HIT0_9ZZZZ